jgi:arylsulfatase A
VIIMQRDKDRLVRVGIARRWVEEMKDPEMQHGYIEVEGGGHVLVAFENLPAIFEFFNKHQESLKTTKTSSPRERASMSWMTRATFTTTHLATSAVILLMLSLIAWGGRTVQAAAPPNVVLIFIDDMGWKDVGCYGSDFIDTPRIDRLATEGIRFTDFYAAGAVCSPTRCAVQSGQNQARIGITDFISGHWRPFERVITPRPTMALPLDIVTVAESLKSSGYQTGYIGKWHLGNAPQFQPQHQGYDFAAVINGPHLPGMYRVAGRPDLMPKADQYRTDFEADLSIKFIEQNKSKPFFLMLSPYAVHIPLAGMSEKVKKYEDRAAAQNRKLPHPIYAAMVEHCDDMVGRIVDAVDSAGLQDNTMIIFTSDNGGLFRRYDYREHADDEVSSLAPLKGEKGALHEGGVRVPLIVRFPPLGNAGTTCAEPTISYDFYPTFVDFAGGQLPANQTIDGLSIKPLLTDPAARLDRDAIHWHYPHYHHDRPASSIRERDWKLIEYLDGSGDLELYQIASDIGETNNLASERKGKASDLQRKLREWRTTTLAAEPIPNPSYDPDRAHEWWSTRSGAPVDSDSRKRFPQTEMQR